MLFQKFSQLLLVSTLQHILRNLLSVFVEFKSWHRLNFSIFSAWIFTFLFDITLPERNIFKFLLHLIELRSKPLARRAPRRCVINDNDLFTACLIETLIKGVFVFEVFHFRNWIFITLFHHFKSFYY